ncbi:MAG: disulfide bond formation protein DsbA [Candidatus Andersenbacteria bacterium CG10_big_fil_rev_8_21_14_0_10_54_11]|uniref:Disulfide bond formation protein DsbA n=1 Tax=Candidatus Andersenbacteria bacterium CG10_big_fil_rev_8_21_14_0_10_54_11 TaxID=1974485 RepID=A0A2M6WYP2_9BACT|nr:MAG: disulfide bond formation protein DsbA [Candidatus Andersenbacteria bacterium CG10_big_fil_rev_8_21_14_0_10_54_11]
MEYEAKSGADLSKAERKQMRRAEKLAQREAAARRKARRRQLRWLAAAGVLVLIIAVAARLASQPGSAVSQPDDAPVLAVLEDDWVRGEAAAAATLIEYGDFQCPACGAYYPILNQLEEEFDGQLRVVYRHFPLEQAHQHAREAALAAEAAGRQGKFWEMHDVLFERQTTWAVKPAVRETFADYAAELGLNREQFVADLDSPAAVERVQAQQKSGVRLRVNSTPTFFLNGERLEYVRTYDDFRQRILDVLAQPAV